MTTRQIRDLKLTPLLVVAALLQTSDAGAQTPWTTTNIVINAAPPLEAARVISRAFGYPVCFEETRPTTNSIGRGFNRVDERVTFATTNATLPETLNKLITIATNYMWTVDSRHGVINVFPRNGSLMDNGHSPFTIQNKSIQDVLVKDDDCGLHRLGIKLDSGRGNLQWLKNDVSFFGYYSTRQLINAICKQLPFVARWELCWPRGEEGPALLLIRGCY